MELTALYFFWLSYLFVFGYLLFVIAESVFSGKEFTMNQMLSKSSSHDWEHESQQRVSGHEWDLESQKTVLSPRERWQSIFSKLRERTLIPKADESEKGSLSLGEEVSFLFSIP